MKSMGLPCIAWLRAGSLQPIIKNMGFLGNFDKA